MEPRNIGRALGIGVRVAGRIAGQKVVGSTASGAHQPPAQAQRAGVSASVSAPGPTPQAAVRAAAETGRNVSKGVGGFLRPFRRVGGIVWLEATGTFFLLFALLFALRLWQNWSRMTAVSRDLTIGAAVLFLYLGVSAFWRARRR